MEQCRLRESFSKLINCFPENFLVNVFHLTYFPLGVRESVQISNWCYVINIVFFNHYNKRIDYNKNNNNSSHVIFFKYSYCFVC